MKKSPLRLAARGRIRQHGSRLPVYAWSLGCPKNRADTERLLGSLGLPVDTVASIAEARLVFINTCAFIEPAVRESLRAIFDAGQTIRRLRRKPLLAVAGCLPGRYGTAPLRHDIPEVDLWLDPATLQTWPEQIGKKLKLASAGEPGRIFSSPAYAWLKIAEGCQHHCAFCTIPSIRGPLRSELAESIIDEAARAVGAGIREINLVAQDVTAWGKDFPRHIPTRTLPALLKRLAQLPGLAWLRLLYLYPGSISDDLLGVMADGAPILPYLDIPFQHSALSVLKNMGRAFTGNPRETVARIRKFLPDAALRATFMVGYPGESEQDFQDLCDFAAQTRFHNLGVFVFQPEEGTAAASLPGQVPPETAEERKNELLRLQAAISSDILAQYMNQRLDVLVDRDCSGEWPGLHAGRVWFQAPEVDGITYISGPGVKSGALVNAEIVDTQTYDMSALAISPEPEETHETE